MPKTKNQRAAASAFLALIFAEVFWGANKPVIKLGLETIPLPTYLSVTILGTALLILPLALKNWKPLSKKDYATLILGSVISISLGNVMLLMGLQRIPTVNASLISLFGPLILFICSVRFLKERLSFRAFSGVIVAFAGASIIVGRPWMAHGSGQSAALGTVLIILGVLCDIVWTLICKSILKRANTYQVNFIHLFTGILPVALFSLKDLPSLAFARAGKNGYVAIILNIIAITLANCLFVYGLKRKKAQEVGIFSYVNPLTTLVVAWIVLSETPSVKVLIGGALIFAGIYMAEARRSSKLMLRTVTSKA